MKAPRHHLLFVSWLLTAGVVSAQTPLDLLHGGWPRAFWFRQVEEGAVKQKDFAAWSGEFGGLMGIMGKALDEEVVGRSRTVDFFTRFKAAHPAQAVLLHMNGHSRDPRFECGDFFAGHWLYFNGARITADVPAQSDETDIHVADADIFDASGGRKGRGANDDIGLCALGANGQPDWSQSEQVELLAVDKVAKTIRVRRAVLGTKPRAFTADKSYAAAHCVQEPGGTEGARNRWLYNFSTTCPRDARGRSCNDVFAAQLGAWFARDGRLAAFDGLEFDTMYHEPHTTGKRVRGADCDADGGRDDGIIGGVNVYGGGVIEFARKLRGALGEQRLIMADGAFRNEEQQRATGWFNGIESEGWPNLQDKDVTDWSGGLNRQSYWRDHGHAPVLNYINHKFNDPGGGKASEKRTRTEFHITRLVFAAAVFTDSAITYMMSPEGAGLRSSGVWDELIGGTLKKSGWLGQPLGPAKHLAASTPDTLRGAWLKQLTSDDAKIEISGGIAKLTAKDAAAKQITVRVKAIPCSGPDLFLTLTARGEPMKNHPPEMARLIHAGIGEARVMSWLGAKEFTSTFYFSSIAAPSADLELTFESGEPVFLTALTAHAAPDAMLREFEHGLVLANPSPHPMTFDLAKVCPGKSFQRLHGSEGQDTKTNNGTIITSPLTLAAKDALFLTPP